MSMNRLYTKAKANHDLLLRLGFAIFLAIWGLDRVFRADLWATEGLMGHFYGNLGLVVGFVAAIGALQVLIALSFLFNFQVKYTSLLLLAMLVVSTVVTIAPLVNYLVSGGSPVPAILFSDHFPLMAGAWAIYAHCK